MTRLSRELGGPALWVKRDDCTGLATGGNKTRKPEFLIAEALEQGADMVITQGAVQSNHVRQTAAAACRHGLDCHALLERRVAEPGPAYDTSANVFLDHLFGTTLEYRPPGLDMNAETQLVAQRLRADGRRPYFIPGGGSNATGALGYVSCAQELVRQSDSMGSGSTGWSWRPAAPGPRQGWWPVSKHSNRLSRSWASAFANPRRRRSPRCTGWSMPRPNDSARRRSLSGRSSSMTAMSALATACRPTVRSRRSASAARTEGLLLDPVYSGKGFAGLLGLVRQGFFRPTDNVVFLHTGGAVALFAYEQYFTSDH
ncbi:MAG: D-cysteine desulfhydrase family protein [Burkholderiaceae bacterium]